VTDLLSTEDIDRLRACTREEAQRFYAEVWAEKSWPLIAELGKKDRFFLLTWILNRKDMDRDWLYARCREVEAAPDGYLDLWAREHYKSTIITFGGVIQEIVRDPEITIGIFSHTKPVAKTFLVQIKTELETNVRLKAAYPEIFHKNPSKEARTWSEDKGIVVKRKSNPKESTVEANGLVEGMPVGRHYRLMVYDDVVTQESVTTPEQIEKTTQAWELSGFLGQVEGGRRWHIGTRYHFNDTYKTILDREAAIPRVYAATADGTPSGVPVLISPESLEKTRREKGPYVFACQYLLNPVADDAQGFKREWIRFYEDAVEWKGMNRYICVDPANEKKKNSDFSVFWVLGLAPDNNIYVLDCVRDRVNLTERADILFALHRQYKPNATAYEKYGKDSDIQHFEDRMRRENYRFSITPVGGVTRKEDRIRRLVPLFEQGRVYLPEVMLRNSDGRQVDLVKHFIDNEYLAFPVAVHDDMLDAMARVLEPDLYAVWPRDDTGALDYAKRTGRTRYERKPTRTLSWMSM
jgi:predicted phage terminase large subunit-like protein